MFSWPPHPTANLLFMCSGNKRVDDHPHHDEKQTNLQKARQTDRRTDTQKNRQKDRQTDRHTGVNSRYEIRKGHLFRVLLLLTKTYKSDSPKPKLIWMTK